LHALSIAQADRRHFSRLVELLASVAQVPLLAWRRVQS
jgi:hypothetical protein